MGKQYVGKVLSKLEQGESFPPRVKDLKEKKIDGRVFFYFGSKPELGTIEQAKILTVKMETKNGKWEVISPTLIKLDDAHHLRQRVSFRAL